MRIPRRFPGWVLLMALALSGLAVACGGQPTQTATTAPPTPVSASPVTVAPEPEPTAPPAPAATVSVPAPTTAPAATATASEATSAPAATEPAPSATPVEAMTPPGPEDVLTFVLAQLNGSGQSGFATLTDRGEQTEVVLTISAGALETELVHIHSGRCGDTLGGVVHPLTSFADGAGVSVTTVDAALSSLRNGDFAINSHKKGEPPVYTTCGNIPEGEPVAMTPDQEAPVVTLLNFQFVPVNLEVQAGKKARFTVISKGASHTFTIPVWEVDVVLPAGTTRTVEFDVPDGASGEQQLLCRFHSSGGTGMVAKITVIGGGGGY